MTTEISMPPERVNEAESGAAVRSSDLFCRTLHESLIKRSEFWRTAKTDAHGINTAVYVCLAEICSALNDVEAHGPRPITPEDVTKEADRNYDMGRKHGKDESAETYETLYGLVEAYLCTPNTSPAVEDAYDNLVAWFVRNKRPDGSEPLPVSPEQAK